MGRMSIGTGRATEQLGWSFRQGQGALHSCSEGSAVEPDEGQMGNVGLVHELAPSSSHRSQRVTESRSRTSRAKPGPRSDR